MYLCVPGFVQMKLAYSGAMKPRLIPPTELEIINVSGSEESCHNI